MSSSKLNVRKYLCGLSVFTFWISIVLITFVWMIIICRMFFAIFQVYSVRYQCRMCLLNSCRSPFVTAIEVVYMLSTLLKGLRRHPRVQKDQIMYIVCIISWSYYLYLLTSEFWSQYGEFFGTFQVYLIHTYTLGVSYISVEACIYCCRIYF